MDKRIEAATVLDLPWCIEELYMCGSSCSSMNSSGYTPLHLAAARNLPRCVMVLLNMKMDVKVNAVTKKGYTPLYLALAVKAEECAAMIREAGGVESMTVPIRGYRGLLDIHVEAPRTVPFVNRAADDRARNLSQPPYFGLY